MRLTRMLTATVIGVGLALAGCGDEDAGTDQPAFNDADIAFAQDMIPHHQQALMLATLATDRARDPAVDALAGRIQRAQEPEIETMQGWLKEWDAEVSHAMETHHGDMAGMVSQRQMSKLMSASGRAFDRIFLRLMIKHHEGAVEMARTEQREGTHDEAVELAGDIESAQSREIEQMESLLDR